MNSSQPWLLAVSVALAVGATIPTLPPVCRRLVRLLKVDRANPRIDAAVAGLNWPLLLGAWPPIACGWVLMAGSLWAVLCAMPNMGQPTAGLGDLPLLVAAVCLATALGFLSLIPGGLGVREMVIIPLLAPRFSVAVAAIAAVLLRLVWLVSEVLISIILYYAVRAPSEAARSGN